MIKEEKGIDANGAEGSAWYPADRKKQVKSLHRVGVLSGIAPEWRLARAEPREL
ncbi:hypothetical protein AB0J55_07805 [Amycolatopsis sp. NPDC049688]|uniref:hypothetical protein n=1 Tax=Amycolatopsis sp. NPDC049688 TaxID=3154733 RepID=UPI00342A218B